MVAADVHGKNHHVAGCFGEHVRALRMRLADGRIVECSDDAGARAVPRHARRHGPHRPHPRGRVPLERIPSPWIWQESEQVPNLDTALERLAGGGREWPFTVCWIDLLDARRRAWAAAC